MIASSIDDKGNPVNPRFTFPPAEQQITALVQVGQTEGALTVTWYQKTDDDKDRKLFEHQIQVKGYDRAFSTGKNPGPMLAAGSYKVVASIFTETKTVEFDIARPKASSQNRPDSANALIEKIAWYDSPQDGTAAPADSGASGQVPVAGPSGALPKTEQSNDTIFSLCDSEGSPCDKDSVADTVGVYSFVLRHGGGEVKVYDANGGRLIGSYRYANAATAVFEVDPCWSGGSDVPGTKLAFMAVLQGISAVSGEETARNLTISLGDDTLAPRVHVISTPARGSRVKPGDKINLKVDASELRSGGPWQTGVKMVQVTALPGGQVGEPWVNSASPLAQKCGQKTWEQNYEATYTVPSNPPPLIKICALAEDYVGNEGSICGDFPTGQYYGSIDWSTHQTVPSGTQDWNGHADLTLNEDGHGGLTGTLVGTETQTLAISTCHGSTSWTLNAKLAGDNHISMSLNATDRHSTRPEEASCGRARTGGDLFMWPQFDELLRQTTANEGDGSYRSEHEIPISGGTAKFKLIIRPSK